MESESLKKAHQDLEQLKSEAKSLQEQMAKSKSDHDQLTPRIYEATLREAHIQEIYRLAKLHFPRLFRVPDLRECDIQELEKWIGRAKTSQALVDIVEALKQLKKYRTWEIKSNLYALVQKIIIEGPYEGKKR